ncbi:MAG: hypothetical protein FWD09_04160, partial [Lentimicrobiaceae bacterium]|nr:hypothetical protein [Lentimicrobiaceae bacterium]
MKNFYLSLTLMLALSMSVFAQFSGGNGTESNPYIITTPAQLAQLATYVNTGNTDYDAAHYRLGNDIDLSAYQTGTGWTPIGDNTTIVFNHNARFHGTFDGNRKVVSNLMINRTSNYGTDNNQGLFGYTEGATIKNLGVEIAPAGVTGRESTGGLVGYAINTTITGCYTTGNVTGTRFVGGLVGTLYSTTATAISSISVCYSTANVTGTDNTGGLVGFATNYTSPAFNTISNCYATGNVTTSATSNSNVGGLIGQQNYTHVTYCYATGYVKGGDRVAGITGYRSSDSYQISNNVAANIKIESTTTAAYQSLNRAVTVFNVGSNMYNYANDIMIVENQANPGNIGTIGLTQRAGANVDLDTLYLESFYTTGANWQNGEAWDFDNIWKIDEGSSYPYFKWQTAPAFTPTPKPQYFQSGTGYPENPYMVCTAAQLDSVRYFRHKSFKLCSNIDLTAYLAEGGFGYTKWGAAGWQAIGDNDTRFTGTMNGARYKVSGLWLSKTSNYGADNYQGFFGYTNGAAIQNLGVEIAPAGVTGRENVGGLVGYCNSSTITDCYTTGKVSGTLYVGGLVGYSYSTSNEITSTISTCYSTANVTGTGNYAGGLVGIASGATNSTSYISNCYATGNVTGASDVGGLVGYASSWGAHITYCYATGNVMGSANVGGIVGQRFNSSSQLLNNVAANIKIEATSTGTSPNRVTASVNTSTNLHNYANDIMIVEKPGNPGDIEIISLTRKAGANVDLDTLYLESFYTTGANWLNGEAWDFDNIWKIDEGSSYPYFKWQTAPAFTPTPKPYYFQNGDGYPENPYMVCTDAQLDSVRYFRHKSFKLCNDIDLTAYLAEGGFGYTKWGATGWHALGDNNTNFTGTMNGARYKVSGLWLSKTVNNGTSDNQ